MERGRERGKEKINGRDCKKICPCLPESRGGQPKDGNSRGGQPKDGNSRSRQPKDRISSRQPQKQYCSGEQQKDSGSISGRP